MNLTNETFLMLLLSFIIGELFSSSMDLAQLNFTVKLLQKVAEDDRSVILSPLSISTSLFMIYLAADGETKQQLQNVLGRSNHRLILLKFDYCFSFAKNKDTSYNANCFHNLLSSKFEVQP